MDEQTIWLSFFNRTFELAELAYAGGLLTHNDIVEQEAFLFLGLPALAALECVAASSEQGTLRLSVGGTLREDNCPEAARSLVSTLLRTKVMYDDLLYSAEHHQRDIWHGVVQQWALYGSEARERRGSLPPELDEVQCQRLCAALQGVATQMSQMHEYRLHFNSILDILEARDTNSPSFRARASALSATSKQPKVSPDMLKLYHNFFNRFFNVAEDALTNGIVAADELRAAPEWLRAGLTALVAFGAAWRSLNAPPGQIELSDGSVYSIDDCPAEGRPFISALTTTREALKGGRGALERHRAIAERAVLRWQQDGPPVGIDLPASASQSLELAAQLVFCLSEDLRKLDCFNAMLDDTLVLVASLAN